MPGPAAQRLGHLGVGGFTYDALDNPRTSAIGARSLSHNFDAATNRLTSLSGSQNIAFRYDANGKTCLRSWGQVSPFP